jgi:predicted RecB family endonuclease
LSHERFSSHGIRVSDKTLAKLLREHGYSLQARNKSVEGELVKSVRDTGDAVVVLQGGEPAAVEDKAGMGSRPGSIGSP